MSRKQLLLPLWIIVIIGLSISSCAYKQVKQSEPSAHPLSEVTEIAFLGLHITSVDENTPSKIDKLVSTRKEGKLKDVARKDYSSAPYHLEIEIEENGKVTDGFNVEHPLFKYVEYFDGDQPVRKFAQSKEAEFTLRFLVHQGSITKVHIYEILDVDRKQKIATIKL